MTVKQNIIPALIPKNKDSLTKDIESLNFAHELQIDIVDGNFVSTISWPYEPAGEPSEIQYILSRHSFEVDMMVSDQITAAETWVNVGARTVIFHVEGVDLSQVKYFAEHHTDVNIAVAINNQTPLQELQEYLSFIDMVQLMGISQIGAQGSAFDERVLDRVTELRSNNPNLLISIDGSMNEHTLKSAKNAGADRFVVGSALLKLEDRYQQYKYLTSLIVG